MNCLPQRKNIRLRDYDYSSNAAYFITICTQDRAVLFGEAVGADSISARIELNNAGIMIDTVWNQTINEIPNVESEKHTVMPNHFHCIISISRADMESAPTVCDIIQSFKRNTTVKYINGVKSGLYPPFSKRIWQRNYYDHIIRDKRDYLIKWNYIDTNPVKWENDEYYV